MYLVWHSFVSETPLSFSVSIRIPDVGSNHTENLEIETAISNPLNHNHIVQGIQHSSSGREVRPVHPLSSATLAMANAGRGSQNKHKASQASVASGPPWRIKRRARLSCQH